MGENDSCRKALSVSETRKQQQKMKNVRYPLRSAR